MANNVDPDETVSSGSTLFVQISVLFCWDERIVSAYMSHIRIRNRFVLLYAYVIVTYAHECRMSNLHMCKEYEIFTSYKIAKKNRHSWIVS